LGRFSFCCICNPRTTLYDNCFLLFVVEKCKEIQFGNIVNDEDDCALGEFRKWLQNYLRDFNMDEDKRDQATKVANNLIDLKDQIVESQMKLAECGQKLDLLVEKSDALKIETKAKKARAKEVKNIMW